MPRYPKTYSVKVTRWGDDEVFVSWYDSTGRYENRRRMHRDDDRSSLPRYVRDKLSEWTWGDHQTMESTTSIGW
jgi:hypothetical protein